MTYARIAGNDLCSKGAFIFEVVGQLNELSGLLKCSAIIELEKLVSGSRHSSAIHSSAIATQNRMFPGFASK